MATIPFEPPYLLTARRKAGFVDVGEISEADAPLNWDGETSMSELFPSSPPQKKEKAASPTHLKRTQTMAGNIVVFEDKDGSPPQAFWLQRKIGKSSNGVIRLGYKLRPNSKQSFKGTNDSWELATDASGMNALVTVSMMHSSILDLRSDDKDVNSPLDELSALQMIAKHDQSGDAHVVGTDLVATCSQHVYAILPYHRDGTLLQYCQNEGSLEEPVARFFFRQILTGLKTLQDTGLCHRNLSLDAIELNGDHVDISHLGWSLRFDKKAPVDEDRPLPAPGGDNPQYIAPEYFGNIKGVWDGFAADLWACGLILYSMVVSSEALFVAPIPGDRTFVELCVKGKTAEQAAKYGKSTGVDIALSDDLVDLLRRMLKSDPNERLSLHDVMEHVWVKNGEASPPSRKTEHQSPVPETDDGQEQENERDSNCQ